MCMRYFLRRLEYTDIFLAILRCICRISSPAVSSVWYLIMTSVFTTSIFTSFSFSLFSHVDRFAFSSASPKTSQTSQPNRNYPDIALSIYWTAPEKWSCGARFPSQWPPASYWPLHLDHRPPRRRSIMVSLTLPLTILVMQQREICESKQTRIITSYIGLTPISSLFKALQLQMTRRTMSDHGPRNFFITPSRFQWHKFKDSMHYAAMLGLIPITALITYVNIFVGPAQLEKIPDGYVPKHWEYHRVCYYLFIPKL